MHSADLDGVMRIPAPEGVAIWLTMRTAAAGLSSGAYSAFNLATHVDDHSGHVEQHRAHLGQQLGCDVQWLNQVHGTQTVQVDRVISPPTADAAWTDIPSIALGVLTADCIPLVLASLDGAVVGVVHAGWRGLAEGIIPHAIGQMGVRADATFAWVGPCISWSNYEVGQDVWRHFIHTSGLKEHQDNNKRYLDLAQIAFEQLAGLGLRQIELSGLCTFADERFYSHRQHKVAGKTGQTGRFATLVAKVTA